MLNYVNLFSKQSKDLSIFTAQTIHHGRHDRVKEFTQGERSNAKEFTDNMKFILKASLP